jgi:3D (Asp-Asp-Asp) domain-containing protein
LTKKIRKIIFVGMLVFAMVFSSVTAVSAADYIPPATPTINSFTASATNIVLGDIVTLSWDVSDATSIEILGLEKLPEEDLPLIGELEVWPMESTSYVLNAYGENGTMVTATVDVNADVAGPVEILAFTATPNQIQSGDIVLLEWQVKNAASIEIIGLEKLPEKELPVLEGELEVWPFTTTTYVLQATGFKGEIASASVTVTIVDEPVSIDVLSIEPGEIELGETATISWSATNAEKVNISGIDEDLPAEGTIEVQPEEIGTITYEVTATGASGDIAVDSIELIVNEPPPPIEIVSFEATAYSVSRGTLVKISWDTENATGCMILTSDGLKLKNRPADGSISITPNVTRSYTLIAYDDEGNVAEKTIEIEVK